MVDIGWSDGEGNNKCQRFHAIDVSDSGMQIEITEPLRERSYVNVRAEKLGVHGTASVRSCIRKGLKYRVGLEFSASLRRTLQE
jgi:hypothetical protein